MAATESTVPKETVASVEKKASAATPDRRATKGHEDSQARTESAGLKASAARADATAKMASLHRWLLGMRLLRETHARSEQAQFL
jgi:hypothetical protein